MIKHILSYFSKSLSRRYRNISHVTQSYRHGNWARSSPRNKLDYKQSENIVWGQLDMLQPPECWAEVFDRFSIIFFLYYEWTILLLMEDKYLYTVNI